jgi:hypothetical protein
LEAAASLTKEACDKFELSILLEIFCFLNDELENKERDCGVLTEVLLLLLLFLFI